MTEENDKTPKDLSTIAEEQRADYDLVDFYVSYNFAEAELIRDILLDNDVDCYVKKGHPSQFPMNVGKHGQIRIAIEGDKTEEAKQALEEAIEAEALTGEGHFVTGEDTM
ncbi:MAG: hypothetical protein ACQEVA_14955 [Myxococcota bacterium]